LQFPYKTVLCIFETIFAPKTKRLATSLPASP